MTRFNFPQAEAFNPLGILLAHHLTQFDETQRNAAGGTEDNGADGDQPRPEVADAILTISAAPGPQSADGGESSGASDGIVVQNSRSADPTLPQSGIPIDSIRVDFTSGNLHFTTESTLDITFVDGGSGDTPEGQSSATNIMAEDRVEVGTSTLAERVPEGTIITSITHSE